jgi:hypothetical protein
MPIRFFQEPRFRFSRLLFLSSKKNTPDKDDEGKNKNDTS